MKSIPIREQTTRTVMPWCGHVAISFLLNGTNPYERVGAQIRAEVYRRCHYEIQYAPTADADRVEVYKELRHV